MSPTLLFRAASPSAILLSTLAFAVPAAAADPPAAKPDDSTVIREIKPKDASVFKFDFGVPSSPALTLLGVDKDKVTQSNSLRPFVLSLPSLVSGKETGQSAALDVAPAAFLTPADQQTFQEYSSGKAFWYRTRTALGLYNGVSDSDASKQKPSKLSVGLSTSFLDSSDPLLASFPGKSGSAWVTCFDSIRPYIEISAPTPNGANAARVAELQELMRKSLGKIRVLENRLRDQTLEPEVRDAIDAARVTEQATYKAYADEYEKLQAPQIPADAPLKGAVAEKLNSCKQIANRAANLGSDFDFGVGGVWSGDPGKIEHMKHPGSVVWASYRRSFGVAGPRGDSYDAYKKWYDNLDQWFMAGVSARVGLNEHIATGDKTTPQIKADTYSVWLGLERYTKESRLALQIGEEKTDPRESAQRAFKGTRGRWQATYDQKLNDDGLWITATYGEANGTGALKDDKTAKVTFTFTSPDPPKVVGGP